MDVTKSNIIKSLVYFELFQHPLSKEELLLFHGVKSDIQTIQSALNSMLSEAIVYEYKGFYALQDQKEWVDRRIDGNVRAKQALSKAERIGRNISKLPFIRSVSLSGTIAKGVMYKDSDVDYFVITQANRIWLAKFFLKFYKLVFHLNSSKNLCYNYLLSDEHLEIKAQNVYTATEISTLIPIHKNATFIDFLKANQWKAGYFPNALDALKDDKEIVKNQKPFLSSWMEKGLSGTLGDQMDNWVLKKIKGNYQQKYERTVLKEGMKTTKNVSKTHPNDMQKKVIDRYDELLHQYLSKVQNNIIQRNV